MRHIITLEAEECLEAILPLPLNLTLSILRLKDTGYSIRGMLLLQCRDILLKDICKPLYSIKDMAGIPLLRQWVHTPPAL
jgi:hypothetical protein